MSAWRNVKTQGKTPLAWSGYAYGRNETEIEATPTAGLNPAALTFSVCRLPSDAGSYASARIHIGKAGAWRGSHDIPTACPPWIRPRHTAAGPFGEFAANWATSKDGSRGVTNRLVPKAVKRGQDTRRTLLIGATIRPSVSPARSIPRLPADGHSLWAGAACQSVPPRAGLPQPFQALHSTTGALL